MNPCLTNTWYLNNEMQYLFLSIPLLFITLKWKQVGVIIWIVIIIINIVLLTILTNVSGLSSIVSIHRIQPELAADVWNNYHTVILLGTNTLILIKGISSPSGEAISYYNYNS